MDLSKQVTKWKDFFTAMLKSNQQLAVPHQIAKHLARVALFEWQGINALYPDVKDLAQNLQEIMRKKGKPIMFVELFRTAKRQNYLYSKGRTKEGRIVTSAKGLQSYHQFGLAFDVKFVRYGYNPPAHSWWTELGIEGKALGLAWGGDWAIGDFGHFESHYGFDWKSLEKYFNEVE